MIEGHQHEECLQAMQAFVDRCDAGLAISTHTYVKFKEIIARHRGLVADHHVDAAHQATALEWCRSHTDVAANSGT